MKHKENEENCEWCSSPLPTTRESRNFCTPECFRAWQEEEAAQAAPEAKD
jgi:hypothetical protein